MPTFYFDLEDGSREKDRNGVNLSSAAEAHDQAVLFLASVMTEDPAHIRRDNRLVKVRDERGRVLFEIGVYSVPAEDEGDRRSVFRKPVLPGGARGPVNSK